jgi:hypothetical protein
MKVECGNCGDPMEVPTEKPEAGDWACEKCSGPDWSGKCEVCDASPIVPLTGLCGPCTFGEAETAGGNW